MIEIKNINKTIGRDFIRVEKFIKIDLEKLWSVNPCTSYKIEIFSDGLVKYLKGYYEPDSGEYYISSYKIKKLNELIKKYDFFGIYEKEPTRFGLDGFECIIKITMESGSSREIIHHEVENRYSDTLIELENKIEKLIRKNRK